MKKGDFECNNATDRNSKPYKLVSSTTDWGDPMEYNSLIYWIYTSQFDCEYFHIFYHTYAYILHKSEYRSYAVGVVRKDEDSARKGRKKKKQCSEVTTHTHTH